MNLKRISRLLQLLKTLQSGQGQDASGLAKQCGVSRRTVFRDLATLREAGVPLEFDTDSERYMIPSSFFLPPTNFTASEALSIIALANHVGGRNQLPFYEAARTAALKIESSLPAALREELGSISKSLRIDLDPVSHLEGKQPFYDRMVKAISAGKVLKTKYQSLTEWETVSTRLRPYRLLFSRRSWYVVGRSSVHREVRMFNLARFSEVELTSQKYKIPASFSLEEYLGNAWHLIPEPGPDQRVAILFEPLVAQNVAEVVWHRTQQTTMLRDGRLEFRALVSGLNEIAWWILGYGDQAEVIKPVKLRKLVARRAANMHAIYSG